MPTTETGRHRANGPPPAEEVQAPMQNDSRKSAPKMERTRTPGIFKRGGRYVVVYRDGTGRQHKESHRTLEEAREAKGRRDAGDRRTSRGLSERTRALYRRDLERWAVPYFGRRRLAKVERRHVRAFVTHLEAAGLAPSSVRAVLAPVKAMFAEALEDGAVIENPTTGVRITGRRDGTGRRKARAMTRAELSALLAAVPDDHRLFFASSCWPTPACGYRRRSAWSGGTCGSAMRRACWCAAKTAAARWAS